MTPYEILLSESQERMLVCVKKGKEKEVQDVFKKWELISAIIGETNNSGVFKVRLNGETVAEVPSDCLVLGGSAPIYHREIRKPEHIEELSRLDLNDFPLDRDWNHDLLALLSAPNICNKNWVFNQYDSMVRTNTAVGPGSDAAVLRLRKTRKAIALTTDCNARYCYLNPRLGAQQAVAEAARNVVCSGARPVAITNCLNFGNPYKPEIYFGFSESIAGMGEACRIFETPVTGGNVSFYNEDPEHAVFPTPVIGMLGIVDDINHIATQWFKEEGDLIFLVGENENELGASEYLHTIFGRNIGPVPALNLHSEKILQDTVLTAIKAGLVKSAHDCADGGLAVALAEGTISNRERMIGAEIYLDDEIRPDCLLFGETQSRIIVTISRDSGERLVDHCVKAGVPVAAIGRVGGNVLKINDLINLPLGEMKTAYYNSLKTLLERFS
jgi:phosphoribosylformylglycinamidine synthase